MSNNKMQIQFLGAAQTVTGSKYLLTIDNQRLLIDCGLYQGLKEYRLRNWAALPIDPATIDSVILTHAHIDHSGYLPLLIKNGFAGKVYCTDATKELCEIMLPDSGFLQEEEAARANRYGYSKHKPALPLYTRDDAYQALKHLVPVRFHQEVNLGDDLKVNFNIGGHILGAATVAVQTKYGKILFSGDVGRLQDPITYAPEPVPGVDYLVLESTYGDKLHRPIDPLDAIAEVVNRTFKRGGTLIIPAFAVGRTQHVIYYLHQLKKAGRIPGLPVFLDSPMARDVTEVFLKCPDEHRLTAEQCAETCRSVTYTNSVEDSKAIDANQNPKIIISASGMATGGRVLHHLRLFAPDPKNTVLFVGYQAPGTRGEAMLNGAKQIKIFGEMVDVNAEVLEITNMSAHGDYQEVLTWLDSCKIKPRRVFITHGETKAAEAMRERIKERFGWQDVTVPKYLQTEKLI